MHEINDTLLLKNLIEHYDLSSWFDTPNLPFQLFEYAAGEMLNILHPSEHYLKFLVKGELRCFTIQEDGTYYQYYQGSDFAFLGDVEFCGYHYEHHWHEAVQKVWCIELCLEHCRESLWQDLSFLKHLSKKLAASVYSSAHTLNNHVMTVEQQVINYLKYAAPNGEFQGVDRLANQLNCSRSQLQRVLRTLTTQGLLEKKSKGIYHLTFPTSF